VETESKFEWQAFPVQCACFGCIQISYRLHSQMTREVKSGRAFGRSSTMPTKSANGRLATTRLRCSFRTHPGLASTITMMMNRQRCRHTTDIKMRPSALLCPLHTTHTVSYIKCYLNKSQLNSLDFTINRLFIKLFKTNNLDIVNYCQHSFGFEMPSVLWAKRITKLNEKIANCTNSFVARFSQV